jgi:hypothetical protein
MEHSIVVNFLATVASLILLLIPIFAEAGSSPNPAKYDGAIPIEPDPQISPGAMDPANVDAALPLSLLCDPTHHTKQDRDVTDAMKLQVYVNYGFTIPRVTKKSKSGKLETVYDFHVGICATPQGCEVDHLCSLENGCKNTMGNLWVQPYQGTVWNAHAKDILENRLHKKACSREITLEEDQQTLSKDWVSGWYKHVSPVPPMPDGSIDKDHTPEGFGL